MIFKRYKLYIDGPGDVSLLHTRHKNSNCDIKICNRGNLHEFKSIQEINLLGRSNDFHTSSPVYICKAVLFFLSDSNDHDDVKASEIRLFKQSALHRCTYQHGTTTVSFILAHQIGMTDVTHVRQFYLTYMYPYQPVEKIKNEQPHVGRTSIRGVIGMLKVRHHVGPPRIKDF